MKRSIGRIEHLLLRRSLPTCLRFMANVATAPASLQIQEYNSMLYNAAKSGYLDDCRKLYSDIRRAGIQPTAETHRCLLMAAKGAGSLEVVFQFFRRMVDEDHISPNIIHYNIVLSCCAEIPEGNSLPTIRKHLGEALYNRLLADENVEPNMITMRNMLLMYTRAGFFDDFGRIKADMNTRGISLDDVGMLQIMTELNTYKRFEMIMDIFREENRQTHTIQYYGIAMNAALNLGLVEEVETIFTTAGKRLTHTHATLSVYLRSLVKRGTGVDVLKEHLENDKYPSNDSVWRSVLNELSLCGDTDSAASIFELGCDRGYFVLWDRNYADPPLELHRFPKEVACLGLRYGLSKRRKQKSDLPLEIIVGRNKEAVSEVLRELAIPFEPRSNNQGRLFITSEAMREWTQKEDSSVE